MVFCCAITAVDSAAVVEVFVLDVTRAINEVVSLDASLVGNARLIFPCAVGILTVKVVNSEVAIGLKAPDVAPCLTFVCIHTCCASVDDATCVADDVRVVVPLRNLRLRVADVELSVNAQIFVDLLAVVKCQLPTACAERTGVGVRRRSTCHARDGLTGSEHVVGGALVPVECYRQVVVQEAEVKTYVSSVDALPCQSRAYP